MPHLSTATGVPTGAILGTTTMLLTIIEELQPQYMGVFFDRKAATYRHEMFEEYKANRETMPDELVSQLVNLKQLIRSWGSSHAKRTGSKQTISSASTVRSPARRGSPASSIPGTTTCSS